MSPARWASVVTAAGLALTCAPASAHAQESLVDVPMRVQPRVANVDVVAWGQRFTTGEDGRVTVRVPSTAVTETGHVRGVRVPKQVVSPGVRVELNGVHGAELIDLNVYYLVRPSFIDLDGDPVSADAVQRLTLKGRTGVRVTFHGDEAKWLQGERVVPFGGTEWLTKRIDYQAESAFVHGSNVVNRGQQRFVPAKNQNPSFALLFYSATFTARDALFGSAMGKAIVLRFPDGTEETHELDDDGTLELPALPRGDYEVSVDALGYSATRPLALSRDQEVELEVISYADMTLVFAILAAIALALLLARRPRLRAALTARRVWPRTAGRATRG